MTDTRKTADVNMTAEQVRRIQEEEKFYSKHFYSDFSAIQAMALSRLQQRDEKLQQNNILSEARKPVEKYILTTAHTTRWTDVAGNNEAKAALISALETPKLHSAVFAHYGKAHSRGVLLSGPPGIGKTMLAKAAVGELSRLHGTSAEMILINGPEIQSPYVGVTERTIRQIFTYAAEYKKANGFPLLIFIDEADALLPARGTSYNYDISNVSAFLAEMDGLKENGAFVMLATNRPTAIDEALLRPGRCDKVIALSRPTKADVEEMLYNSLRNVPYTGELFEIIRAAVSVLFSSEQLQHGIAVSGPHCKRWHVTTEDVLSGAIIHQLVERAKEIAMARDISTGQLSGVHYEDMRLAALAYQKELAASVDENIIHSVLHKFPVETLEQAADAEEFKISSRKGTVQ